MWSSKVNLLVSQSARGCACGAPEPWHAERRKRATKGEKEMSRLREKTTATLLIAIFMISAFAVVMQVSATDYTVSPGDSIQDAIDLAGQGDRIILTAGTFYQGNILVDESVTILGAGKADTIIDVTGFAHGLKIAADDVTIEGLTVQGATHRNIVWYSVTVSGSIIEDVKIQDAGSAGMEVHHSTVTNILVKDCDFIDNANYGLRIDSAGMVNDFTVDGCTFDTHIEAGIGSYGYIDGLTVTGSYFTEAYRGMMFGLEYLPYRYIKNVEVEGSTFEYNYIGINVYVYGTANHEIENIQVHVCSFTDNEWGVKFTELGMKDVYEDVLIDARFNYWGDETGPARQLPNGKWVGRGDKVSGNVDFTPWLPHSWLPRARMD